MFVEPLLNQYKDGVELTKEVRVLNQIFYSESSGFGVYAVEDGDYRCFKVVGEFVKPLLIYRHYSIKGIVTTSKGEKQLKATSYQACLPKDRNGIIAYLKLLPGLDLRANKLYDLCGSNVIEMLKTSPDEVAKLACGNGFSKEKIQEWHDVLINIEAEEKQMRTLLDFGLKAKKAKELLAEYGLGIVDELKKDPYLLLELKEVNFSFKDVDEIALKSGISYRDIYRLMRVIIYALTTQAKERGDTYMDIESLFAKSKAIGSIHIPMEEMIQYSRYANNGTVYYPFYTEEIAIKQKDLVKLIEEGAEYPIYTLDRDDFDKALKMDLSGNKVIRDGDVIQLSMYHEYETLIQAKTNAFLKHDNVAFSKKEVSGAIKSVLPEGTELNNEQYDILENACITNGGIYLLTGPAGSGKTFMANIIKNTLLKLHLGGYRIKCLAPTGKAAQNLSRATNFPSYTIHRYCGKLKETEDLSVDMYIIDEVSMISEEVLAMLFRCIPDNAKVIMLGDDAQLPSIGAGAVLRDFMNNKNIPHIALTVVKRQKADSGILINANKIRNGEMIETVKVSDTSAKNNAYVVYDPPNGKQKILDICKKRGLKAFQEERLQVLLPTNKGGNGTVSFNAAIQKEINPWDGASLQYPSIAKIRNDPLYFRKGDKVIHIKNNYHLKIYGKVNGAYVPTVEEGVMNGESGYIDDVLSVQDYNGIVKRIVVKYPDDKYVFYDDDFSELLHAYAITIHKSQGSQWNEVLGFMGNMGASDFMSRKLIYTLYTRAMDTMYLISSRVMMERGLANVQPNLRKTRLFA